VRALLAIPVVAGVVTAQSPTARNGPETRALSVAQVLDIREFADRNQLDLSPDGRLVAFAVQHPARAAGTDRGASAYFSPTGVPRGQRGSDVLLTDVATGATRVLAGGSGSSWSPAWSPDGRHLAFYSDRDGIARLWLWERDHDRLRLLAPVAVRVYFGFEGIQWSPDGTRVLVKLSPAGATSEALARLLPTATAASKSQETAGARTSPDDVSARVFTAMPALASPGGAVRAPVHLDSARSFLNAELGDLAVIDVATGVVRRVAPWVRAMGYRFSPDGTRVAFSTRQPDGGEGLLVYDRYDLFVVDAHGRAAPRLVARRMVQEYGLGFSWSPDGARLGYYSRDTLHVLTGTATSPPQRLARAGVPLSHEYRAPLWLDEGTLMSLSRDTIWRLSLAESRVTVAATVDGRRLLELVAPANAQQVDSTVIVAVITDATKQSGFVRIDLRRGRVHPLAEGAIALGGAGLAHAFDRAADGSMVFVAERADRPSDVWVADAQVTHMRALTDLSPGATRLALGRSRLVEWTTARGARLRGALLLPAGYTPGTRHPLVVKVYGGSMLSGTVNRFGLQGGVDNLQLLATRGYAVLLPDTPLRQGTPMADLADAVLPGIDAVVALGVADPERLGIMGHSYGGYSSLAMLVQSDRFKAGVSSGGFSSLLSQYTPMREDGSAVGIGWSERDQGRMQGSPWEFRDRYVQNSPFFFLDRVNAPVLLLHGGSDATVRASEAEATFVALRRLGKAATLVRYDGEDHHPGTWSGANATDYWERIFDWFGRHLAR
jgi:dipeptidyl aminopeptidase/acylaminoacyl peptidase